MAVQVPSSPYWQPALGALGETVSGLDELKQALQILLTTPLGSVTLEPEYGCDVLPWLDRPEAEAIPGLIRAVSQAVRRWEPRIALDHVQVRRVQPGELALVVTWRPSDQPGAAPVRTEVRL